MTVSQAGAGPYAALLRGINVGGKNKLPMKDLVALAEELGAADVRTYIQSGNLVCRLTKTAANSFPSRLTAGIQRSFDLRVPVVMRSQAELRAIAKHNPFLSVTDEPKAHHVAFLADRPNKKRLATLDPDRSPGDRFSVRGGDVYMLCPNGVARTKLTTAWLDSKLSTTSTARNWRTVLKLVEMVEA
jgi:uncharacterized protein (DUF1697 family)